MGSAADRKRQTVSYNRSTQSKDTSKTKESTRSSKINIFQVKLSAKEWVCLWSIFVIGIVFIGLNFFWTGQTKQMEADIEMLKFDAQNHQIETDAINEEIMNKTNPSFLEKIAEEASMTQNPSNIKDVSVDE